MNCPTIYNADDLIGQTGPHKAYHGIYVAARPMGWQGISLCYRLRCAWLVFRGKADVLIWTGE